MYVQWHMNKHIQKAKQVCAKAPKSEECKVAWDEIKLFGQCYDRSKIKQPLNLHDI